MTCIYARIISGAARIFLLPFSLRSRAQRLNARLYRRLPFIYPGYCPFYLNHREYPVEKERKQKKRKTSTNRGGASNQRGNEVKNFSPASYDPTKFTGGSDKRDLRG